MNDDQRINLQSFFEKITTFKPDDFAQLVENHLSDEDIELFVDHLEDFYGITDEEDLGTMAQIMITGFIAGRSL